MESEYFARVKPTYIENWPSALCRLSIAQVDIPLTVDEAAVLGSNIVELFETFPEPHFRDMGGIRARISAAIGRFPRGAFVRLGSRSPKDAWHAPARVFTADGALQRLLGGSERVSDDLHLAICEEYAPHIFLREWVDLAEWQEFRCFMRGGELAGISQYFYREQYGEIELHRDSIEWAIRDRFFPDFRSAIHLADCVFDVFVKIHERRNEREVQVKLLEINPFFEMTDPCLFDWRAPEMFDGRMLTVERAANQTNA